MKRKELLFAVIGGIVGAVLVMAAGSIAPLGAQNEVKDAEFGKIICRSILVRNEPGGKGVLIGVGENEEGEIIVPGKEGGLLGIMGSTMLIQSGEIRVMNNPSTANVVIKGYKSVSMGIVGRDEKHLVLIGNTEDWGAVMVQSADGSGQASMGISHEGGIVTTLDKNGNLSWASRGK